MAPLGHQLERIERVLAVTGRRPAFPFRRTANNSKVALQLTPMKERFDA